MRFNEKQESFICSEDICDKLEELINYFKKIDERDVD
jgi:hypothetical protein